MDFDRHLHLDEARAQSKKAANDFIETYGEDEFKQLSIGANLIFPLYKTWRDRGIDFNMFRAASVQKIFGDRIKAIDISAQARFYEGKRRKDEAEQKSARSSTWQQKGYKNPGSTLAKSYIV